MSEQRIEHGAERATNVDADPGEGQGLQTAGSHGTGRTAGGTPGETEDTASGASERRPEVEPDEAQTEGERFIRGTQERAVDAGGEL